MKFIDNMRTQAKRKKKKIVLPEADDERIIKAASILSQEKIASPILIGNEKNIKDEFLELDLDLEGISIFEPEKHPQLDEFVEIYYQKRQHKGISQEEAAETMLGRNFFGTMLVEKGIADGCLSGAATPTGDVLRP
ncbi:MAG: phosphate acetyltransferase, partial [Candidatus Marinimicrobia bacterium]|nr:phosphate acetyltransferase [Candidatus Neomarinimicrobiota bacterium]